MNEAVLQSGETSVIIKANLKSHIVQESSVISPPSPKSPLPSLVPLQSWLCLGAMIWVPVHTSSCSQLTSLPHRRCNIRWLPQCHDTEPTPIIQKCSVLTAPRYVEVRCHCPACAASEHKPGPEEADRY